MDHQISMIMNTFRFTVDEVKRLSLNQYKAYLHHAANLISAYRQGEVETAYKETKDEKLRARLKQLKAEAEAREQHGN